MKYSPCISPIYPSVWGLALTSQTVPPPSWPTGLPERTSHVHPSLFAVVFSHIRTSSHIPPKEILCILQSPNQSHLLRSPENIFLLLTCFNTISFRYSTASCFIEVVSLQAPDTRLSRALQCLAQQRHNRGPHVWPHAHDREQARKSY